MKLTLASVSLAPLLLLAAACTNDDPNKLLGSGDAGAAGCPSTTQTTGNGGGGGTAGAGGGTTTSGTGTTTSTPTVKTVLDERVLSYTEALRTASLKLVGNAPTLEEMMAPTAIAAPITARASRTRPRIRR